MNCFCFATPSGHQSTVWSFAWSPTGSYIASVSDDLTIRIWKRVEGYQWEYVLVLEGAHERTIYSVTWSIKPGATQESLLDLLASAGGDGRVNVWELEEAADTALKTPPQHKLVARLENAHGVSDVNSVVWCPRKGSESLLAKV